MASVIPPKYSQWTSQGAVYGTGAEVSLFFGKTAKSSVNKLYPSIFSSDFFLQNKTPWTHYENAVHMPASLESHVERPMGLVWEAPDRLMFDKNFQRVQKKMHEGAITKIVLATETRAQKKIAPAIFLLNALGKIPKHTHVYGQWSEDRGFLGFTPEILFKSPYGQRDGKTVETMALAGTSSLATADIHLRSAKNLEEHSLVVNDIAHVLANFGQVRVGQMETLLLQSLAHLQTPILLDLQKPLLLQELITALHPTPALGVVPRSRIADLISMRSGYDSFGAPFVVAKSPEEYVGLVGIRQLSWDKEYYYIRCGCGVVKESRSEDEWQELLLKIQSVKKLFGWN